MTDLAHELMQVGGAGAEVPQDEDGRVLDLRLADPLQNTTHRHTHIHER